jgi:hypothetical protein
VKNRLSVLWVVNIITLHLSGVIYAQACIEGGSELHHRHCWPEALSRMSPTTFAILLAAAVIGGLAGTPRLSGQPTAGVSAARIGKPGPSIADPADQRPQRRQPALHQA